MSEYIYETQGEQVIGNPKGFILPKEEIVRCRDCKYYKSGDDGQWCLRSISMKSNHPNGFCAWGERKERTKQ